MDGFKKAPGMSDSVKLTVGSKFDQELDRPKDQCLSGKE